MKIVVNLEVCGRKETITLPDAIDGVNHTTGWVAIKTPHKIRWFNKDRVVDYTVEEEKA